MSIDYEIHALADSLGPGQHSGIACPKCCPSTADMAMSILVDPPTIKAVCHRASCGFKYSNVTYRNVQSEVLPSRARPYTGELHTLDESDLIWFAERFHLPRKVLGAVRKSDGRYMLPIVGPEGSRRGWVSRRPWDGSPLSECGDQDRSPKVLTYMDIDAPVQSWHVLGHQSLEIAVLVEDQISAMCVANNSYVCAVALLGTGVNEKKISEIQRHARHIIIALDSDATGQAFSHARKWGAAFDSCRVVILQRDIKDDTLENIQKIFSKSAPT
jgi:hypothetical protein